MARRLKRLARLGEVLEPALKKLEISQKTRASMVLFLWPRIAGEKISRNARAERVRGKTLFVKTRTSSWATELTFLKVEIMRKIREAVGGELIEDIRFSASGETWEEEVPGEKEEDLENIPVSAEVRKKIEEACSSLREPQLSLFRNFLLQDARLKLWKQRRGWSACSRCDTLVEKGGTCPFCSPGGV